MNRVFKYTLITLLIFHLAKCSTNPTPGTQNSSPSQDADRSRPKQETSPGHGKYKHPQIIDCILASHKLANLIMKHGDRGHTSELAKIYMQNGIQISKYCQSAIYYIREDPEISKDFKSESLWKLIYFYDDAFDPKKERSLKVQVTVAHTLNDQSLYAIAEFKPQLQKEKFAKREGPVDDGVPHPEVVSAFNQSPPPVEFTLTEDEMEKGEKEGKFEMPF